MPDKNFEEMIIRMLTKHENGTVELKENFNTEKVLNKELSKPEKYSNWNEKRIRKIHQLIS